MVITVELSPSKPLLASPPHHRCRRRYHRTIEVWYPTEPPTGGTNTAASPCFWDIRGSLPEEQAAKVTWYRPSPTQKYKCVSHDRGSY